ncbi:hypothetical protein [Sulfurimonas sp.]|uniref:hypothetical protein n=1 Tax=Sulfurimonas sp. TaxID=2022749 RepID=UPI0035697B39
MLDKLKKYLYNNIYINIVQSSKNTKIYVEEVSHDGSSENYEEVIKSSEKSDIYEFINFCMRKSPISYISLLDPSLSQGAAPTCSLDDIKKYCELDDHEYVCVDSNWTYYTPKLDLLEIKGRYKKTGLDFIFSPFYMLKNFFADKVKGEISLYILVNEDYMALSIFDSSKLKFASLLDMQQDDEGDDELVMDVDDEEELILEELENNSVDLEGIDVDDDIDALDDFDDLDDLDSFDDIDDFDEEDEKDDVFASTEKPLEDIVEQNTFGEDYHRFSLIQSAVNTFYKDPKFDGDFIQNAFIADGIALSPEFKRFLEEEMFLNVVVRKIDIAQELCELAKAEKK